MYMRILLVTLAIAGAFTAAVGALFSVSVLIFTGLALLIVALVMGALAAPITRRGRW